MVLSIKDLSVEYIAHGNFGLWTGYIFAINSIIGAGFLSVPWAFANSGWLFSLLYEVIVAIQSYMLSRQTLECMSRAEVLLRMKEEGRDIKILPLKKLFQLPNSNENLIQQPHLKPIITNRLINSPDIVRLVFGDKIGMAYIIALFLNQFGTLVAFGAIFSSSFASNIPLGNNSTCDIYQTDSFLNSCRVKYWVYLLIFSVLTIYMTVRGIEEQRIVQFTMAILRFFVMISIIITCIVDITLHKNNADDSYNNASWPPLIVPEKLGYGIPIIMFAYNYQCTIPTLFQHVNNKTRNLPRANMLSILTCFAFYTTLGLIVPLAISNVPSLVSISYRNFTAGYSQSGRPIWTYLIEYLIIISPALDVFTAYPLDALCISDAIFVWKYGGHKETMSKKVLYSWRFFIAFLPLLISFFVYDLATILNWVGLLSFLIVQIMFPLLHMGLRHLVAGQSVYDIDLNICVQWGFILFNTALFFVVIGLNLTYIE